jgi:hypothetical protein
MADKAKLEIDSRERVAYELMVRIADEEYEHNKEKWLKPDPRTYYLKLFNQCIRASNSTVGIRYIFDNE